MDSTIRMNAVLPKFDLNGSPQMAFYSKLVDGKCAKLESPKRAVFLVQTAA